jgi:hypothetical protein
MRTGIFISRLAQAGLFFCCGSALAQDAEEPVAVTVCRLIEHAAAAHQVPAHFLTRLIWQESSFRSHVVSPAGAQGIAQFMPGTAAERGLSDPFDPEAAIPKSAELLADLRKRFGNWGLAAAAYNAGAGRVNGWLNSGGYLPAETRDYVVRITGHTADDWADPVAAAKANSELEASDRPSCLTVAGDIRRSGPMRLAASSIFAPWGVQLSGNFSKAVALASYMRARARYAAILGAMEPIIIGTRLRSRGARPFYRVRAPAASRAEANALCTRISRAGGACVVLKS